mmetsp:Transcript_9448/g.24485  ORF Transcript_9448/g.24485 Transcript_9448/m.24485 type:complete len:385 (+) Transcript_9448:369-1523(+)
MLCAAHGRRRWRRGRACAMCARSRSGQSGECSEGREHTRSRQACERRVRVPCNAVLLQPVAHTPRAQHVVLLQELLERALLRAACERDIDNVGEGGEAELAQLILERFDAERARKRYEHVERLRRDSSLLVHGHVLKRAHVVQPVGELHDNDAPVLGHGEQHGARVHALVELFVPRGVHLGHLRLALNNPRHLHAKLGAQLLECDVVAVLDRIVQQAGNDGCGIHFEGCEYQRHLDRMRHERLAALPLLPIVRLDSKSQRARNLPDVRFQVRRGVRQSVRVLVRVRRATIRRGALRAARAACASDRRPCRRPCRSPARQARRPSPDVAHGACAQESQNGAEEERAGIHGCESAPSCPSARRDRAPQAAGGGLMTDGYARQPSRA